jgi:hypothetical protein
VRFWNPNGDFLVKRVPLATAGKARRGGALLTQGLDVFHDDPDVVITRALVALAQDGLGDGPEDMA